MNPEGDKQKLEQEPKNMKKVQLAILAAALGLATQAFANSITDYFTLTGTDVTGHGSFTATENPDGSYTATSGYLDLTGGVYAWGNYNLVANPNGTSVAGSPIDLANPGQGVGFMYDNQYFPSQPGALLDSNGLLFNNLAGNFEVNIWGNGNNSYEVMRGYPNGYGYPDTWGASVSFTVPDGGSTVALLGLALGACGLIARRQKLA